MDLHRIQTWTWGARSQWYNVGLGLGISPDTLDAVKRDNRDICADCYGAMLKQWLKEEPALSSLAGALRSPSVNMGHLAQQLMSMGLCELHFHSCSINNFTTAFCFYYRVRKN